MTGEARIIEAALIIEEALLALDGPQAMLITHLRPGLVRYLSDRIPTGGFLRSCLENDLNAAIAHAHPAVTMTQMKTLMQLLNSSFPAIAWGSPENVAAWLGEDVEKEEPT